MKTLIALATIFCMVAAIPVPDAEQSISLVNIPLQGGKVSTTTWYLSKLILVVSINNHHIFISTKL